MVFDEEGEHGGLGLVVVVAQHHDVGIFAENAQRVFVVGLFALPNPRPSELILSVNQSRKREHVHVENEAQSDGSHDVRRAAFFALRQHLRVATPRSFFLLAYRCVDASTKKIVPPPGRLGVSLTRSFFLRIRSPGQPTPPTILCGEKNSASQ